MEYTIRHPQVQDAYAIVVQDHTTGWTLEHVIVPEEHRGNGIGTELVQEVMKWCSSKKIKRLYFYAMNEDFWNSLKDKFPKHIKVDFNLNGEIRP